MRFATTAIERRTRHRLLMPVCAALAVAAAPMADAASFPCAKAQTSVEKMICANPELSTLDEHLGRYYAAARITLTGSETCFANDQKTWLRTVRNACRDAACLKQAYLLRLSSMDALVPGAVSIRHIELPTTLTLEWIVPPAQDKVAAPDRPDAEPLTVRGLIVDEVTDGDGFVVQDFDGRKHLLVPLMFLDGPTADSLTALSRNADTSYEVRGHAAAADSTGRTHFESSRCIFIHRLPR